MSAKKYPSRERYEKKNPVISIRLPREYYEILRNMRKRTGKSYKDILLVGAGKIKLRDDRIKELETRHRCIDVGMCCSCHGPLRIDIDNPDSLAVLEGFVMGYCKEHKQHHPGCLEKKRQKIIRENVRWQR